MFCVFVGGVVTERCPRTPEGLFPMKDGSALYKCHRDDQSAFTFLVDRLFKRNAFSQRRVYLNNYMRANWRHRSDEEKVETFVRNYLVQCTT